MTAPINVWRRQDKSWGRRDTGVYCWTGLTRTSDGRTLLGRFGLTSGQGLENSAAVLFINHESPHYSQCQLRLAKFRGVDKNEFLDQRQLNGNAFSLLREAVQFLGRHLPVAGRIEPGPLSTSIPRSFLRWRCERL